MNGLILTQGANAPGGNQSLIPQVKSALPAVAEAQTLTPEQQAVMDQLQIKAKIIRDMAFPAAMAAAIPLTKEIDSAAFKVYRDRLLQDAGSPTDPIEIMMVEQIMLAHHRVAQLHIKAEEARTVDEFKVYSTAATRLLGEMRRSALALKQYRQPTPNRQFTVIKQQNNAQGQQIAYLDQQGNELQAQIPFSDGGGELGSNEVLQIGVDATVNDVEHSIVQ